MGLNIYLHAEKSWQILDSCYCSFLWQKSLSCVVEWLRHHDCDLTWSWFKTTCTILLCPWKRDFTVLFSAWWSWQAVLNYSHISIKLQADSNILASSESGWDNCLLYLLAPLSLSYNSGG